MKRFCIVIVALLLTSGADARAQWWSTELPTPWAGDYLNGAASSDAAGSFFAPGGSQRTLPAASFGIPTGFGAGWGDVFAAAGGHLGRSQRAFFLDGVIFMGAGLGNARDLLGIETTFTVYDLVGDFLRERSLSIKVHRHLGTHWGVAVGIENLAIAGHTDGGKSAYAALSGVVPLGAVSRSWLRSGTLTLGIGDGRFNAVEKVRRGENGASLFGSVAAEVLPRLSALATWTGQDLVLGASAVPIARLPLTVTVVLLDVERRGGHGARLAVSVGLGLSIGDPGAIEGADR